MLGDGPDDRLLEMRVVGPEWSDREVALLAIEAAVGNMSAAQGDFGAAEC